MRTVLGVALVTVCLGLAGCSLFGKKQSAKNSSPRPFMGSESAPAQRETAAAEPGAPPPGANGLLAGQVIDRFNRRQTKVFIQVVDFDEVQPAAAKLEVETKDDGYFTIPGLKLGRHYKLTARVKDGDHLLSGVTWATPPNPRLSIVVSEDNNSPSTPPLPDPPATPDRKGGRGAGAGPDKSPSATLDPPIKTLPAKDPTRPDETGAAPGGGVGATPAGAVPDTSKMVDGFTRAPSPPKVNIPNANEYQSLPYRLPAPPSPTWSAVPDEAAPPGSQAALPAVPAPAAHMPTGPAPVPSCALVGNKLENFALFNLDQRPWEYQRDRDRKTRLVLLDFWFSTCGPCRMAIPRLVSLQQKYKPYGLEVIGIAYETGAFEQQVKNVREVRGRYRINYLTLLGGGDGKPCPVKTQFQVERMPTLVLLDESGKIIWRSPKDGLDEYAEAQLEGIIWQRLLGQR